MKPEIARVIELDAIEGFAHAGRQDGWNGRRQDRKTRDHGGKRHGQNHSRIAVAAPAKAERFRQGQDNGHENHQTAHGRRHDEGQADGNDDHACNH